MAPAYEVPNLIVNTAENNTHGPGWARMGYCYVMRHACHNCTCVNEAAMSMLMVTGVSSVKLMNQLLRVQLNCHIRLVVWA